MIMWLFININVYYDLKLLYYAYYTETYNKQQDIPNIWMIEMIIRIINLYLFFLKNTINTIFQILSNNTILLDKHQIDGNIDLSTSKWKQTTH